VRAENKSLLFFPQRLWPAIRHGLKEVLQDVFTEQVEDCWRIVFNFIISKMKEGIRLEKHHHIQAHPARSHNPTEDSNVVATSKEAIKDTNKEPKVAKGNVCRRESLLSLRENISRAGSGKRRASRVAPLLDTGQNNKDESTSGV
jgi:hypothetical protein